MFWSEQRYANHTYFVGIVILRYYGVQQVCLVGQIELGTGIRILGECACAVHCK